MSLTEAHENGVRVVRTDAGHVVLREGEVRTPVPDQPGRVRIRRFRNDITIVEPDAAPIPTSLGSFFNLVPHIEREVDSVHERAELIDGREPSGKHVLPPTKMVYGRYVRGHPFRSIVIELGHGLLPATSLPGILTTVGYTLPDDFLPGQPYPIGGLIPKDPHGQAVVEGENIPAAITDTFIQLAKKQHPQAKRYPHDDGSVTYVLTGDDGEFGAQEFRPFYGPILAQYRKLSLDCNANGVPQKLTVHFRWDGRINVPTT